MKKLPATIQSANGAFASLLGGIKRGEVLSDLDAALKEVTLAVIETTKAGEISLKLKIKPSGKSNADSPMYTIESNVSIKKPRKSVGSALFFSDEEGNLLRNDPRQSEIAFHEVEGEKSEPAKAAPISAQA